MKTMTTNTSNQKGFTLIELIIAMGLSVIILAAIGSIFIYTNRLNTVALAEIKQQQTIRNLSNLIARDASMAGYFGCLSLGTLADPSEKQLREDFKIGSNIKLWRTPNPKDQTDTQLIGASLGVDWRPATDFTDAAQGNITNFEPIANSNGLAFYYAQGSAKRVENINIDELSFAATGLDGDLIRTVAQNEGILSLSSCRALHNFKAGAATTVTNDGIVTIKLADIGPVEFSDNTVNEFDPNAMQLMRFSPVVYLAGKPTNCASCSDSVYRFELLSNGRWSPPELLIDNAQAMTADFYYSSVIELPPIGIGGGGGGTTTPTPSPPKATGCPIEADDLNKFSFYKTNNSLLGADLDIKYGLLPAKLDLNINITGAPPIKITSAIQSGNICANRKIDLPDPTPTPTPTPGGGNP